MGRNHLLEGMPFGTPPLPPPPNDLRLYSDASRSGRGAHPLDQVSTWTMVETGYLTTHQCLGVESLLLAPQTFRYMVTVHWVTAMYDTSAVVADVNKQGERIRLPRLVDRANPPRDGNPQRAPGSQVPSGTT